MKKNNLGFVFFGTPDVAAETLSILKEAGFLPTLIVTAPDKPRGRKMLITPPPVKIWAQKNNIPCIQPEKPSEEELRSILRTLGRSVGDGQRKFSAENFRGEQNTPEIFLVVAYGKILPESIINLPKLGSLNVHYSLLPKYRGASPVESAILNGETETGVAIQKMIFKMDAGPIVTQEKTAILPDETAPELRKRLIKIGSELLVKSLLDFATGKIQQIPQDETQATYCKKIKKQDGQVGLGAELPSALYNKFRAYALWPRIFYFKDGKRIIITKARLENKEFIIEKIIPEGGKEIDYKN